MQQSDNGQSALGCYFNPPQIVRVDSIVDGKAVSVFQGKFPVVPANFQGCGRYKYSSKPKL